MTEKQPQQPLENITKAEYEEMLQQKLDTVVQEYLNLQYQVAAYQRRRDSGKYQMIYFYNPNNGTMSYTYMLKGAFGFGGGG